MNPEGWREGYDEGEWKIALVFILPLALTVFVFICLPVMGTFWNSLFRDVSYLPKMWVGFQNYGKVFKDPNFFPALFFTLSFSIVAVTLETFFGLLFALLLNESFPGRTFLRAIILIPWAIPTIVSAKVWKLVYEYSYGVMNVLVCGLGLSGEKINWLGTSGGAFWALIFADVWKTTPFVVLLVLAGLQAIPEDLYKQAMIDGAGLWRRFYKITLPLVLPVLLVSMIFRTIDSLRMFDLVYVLTGGGPGGSTQTLSFLGYRYFVNDRFGLGSTVSVITFGISFAVTLLYLKFGKFRERLK